MNRTSLFLTAALFPFSLCAQEAEKKGENTASVTVKTESSTSKGVISSSSEEVKIHSPWAPKPLNDQAPFGWQYVKGTPSQAYPVIVKLKNGKELKLSVMPYVLKPEHTTNVIQIVEPGYDASKGYQQETSLSASLTASNKELKQAASSLTESITELKELLDSLPSDN